jgi:glycosyltransferase involved in cell wall biosynthesis
MKKPSISIIVPIYNAEKYIDRCMKSIYSQTFTDYEIILVNDGSTDKSAEICKQYQSLDDRIILIDKVNGGAGSARNAGMAVASGRYLAFPDVDDWFEPQMYEELYQIADSGDYDVVLSGVNYYTQNSGAVVSYSRSEVCGTYTFHTREECRKNVMHFFPTTTIFDVPWNKLYKRSVIIDNNLQFTDLRRCQDATFNIDFYNCINSIASLDKAFYNYMENTTADVQRKFPKSYIDITTYYYTHLMKILTEWGVYKEKIKLHYDTSFVISIYDTMNMFDNPIWGFNKKEQREYVSDILERTEIKQFLPNAIVREDTKKQYRIIKNKQVGRIFYEHYKKEIIENLKKNRFVVKCYHCLKRGK